MRSFAEVVVRRRKTVFLVWALVGLAFLPFARGLESRLQGGTRVRGSESELVATRLRAEFGSPFASYAVLVIRGAPSAATEPGRLVLRHVVDALRTSSGIVGTFSLLDRPDTLFIGANGGTFVVVGLRADGAAADSLLSPLRQLSGALAAELRASHAGIELLWTGEMPLTMDLRAVSAADAKRAEARILPLTLLLLLVAFGALAAAALPVAFGAFAIALTLGGVGLVTRLLPVSTLVLNVVTMIGLGLGIDYALLLVSRFREGRARGLDAPAAAIDAAHHAGHSILVSGAAVLVGFLGLLLVPLTDLRSIAVGGAMVTAISMLTTTTLLPGVLATLGHRLELGTMRRATGVSTSMWRRWSATVVRHPLLVLVIAAVPAVVLGAQWRRLRMHTPSGDWLPASIESARGIRALETMRRAGVVQGIRVIVDLPEGVAANSSAGGAAIGAILTRLDGNPAVARATPAGVTPGRRSVLVEVLPADGGGVASAMTLVREIRGMPLPPGVRASVGGMAAFNVDYGDAIRGATPRVVLLVVGATLLALCIGFRSVLVPIKAVALNLLSVAGAFGAVVLVFQDGHGAGLLGLAAPLDGIFPAVPLLVFCIVFGLSMDYEVFLLSRVAEARRAGAGESEAVMVGMRRTAGVITSAALVMIVVFGAFMMGEFVLMKMLGFALAVAVLLDATLIRLALGPALLRLAGHWNWWPGAGASPARARQLLHDVPLHPHEAM